MIINHNIAALNTVRQLNSNSDAAKKSIEKLSSGFRINRAGDDAAGLAISEKMRGQIRGLDQSTRNAQDGISLIQTAEGGLSETHSILQRMRELSVQSATGTYTTSDRQNLQNEFDQLTSEVNRIASDTEFNTKKLLNGDLSATSKTATVVNSAAALTGAGVNSVIAAQTATAGTTTIQLSSGAVFAAATSAVWATTKLSGALAGNALSTDTLTSLKYNAGTTLGLQVGDSIAINGVVGGVVKSSTFIVTATSTLGDFQASITNTLGAASAAIVSTSGGPSAIGSNGLDNFGSGATSGYLSGALVITGQAGASNDITSLSFSAKAADGTVRTGFSGAFNIGINGGAGQYGVGANAGDLAAWVDQGVVGPTTGDSVVAVRASSVIKTSNLTISMSSIGLNVSGTATVTVGSTNGSANIHIGANANQVTALSVTASDATTLGLQLNGVNLSIQTSNSAESAITSIDAALTAVSSSRSQIGAIQNRLEHTINNLGTSSENLTASESRIRDVDMASEMMQFTKNNILSQAAQAMLAQANQQPQGVLQLLR